MMVTAITGTLPAQPSFREKASLIAGSEESPQPCGITRRARETVLILFKPFGAATKALTQRRITSAIYRFRRTQQSCSHDIPRQNDHQGRGQGRFQICPVTMGRAIQDSLHYPAGVTGTGTLLIADFEGPGLERRHHPSLLVAGTVT
jgi:hypothetical protein